MDQLDRLMEQNRRRRRVIMVVSAFVVFAIVLGIALWIGSG